MSIWISISEWIYGNNRKKVTELRFDINELNKYYEIGDSQKLISLAYSHESNITYVKEEEYVELVKLLKFSRSCKRIFYWHRSWKNKFE